MDSGLSSYCRLCAEIKSNTDLIDTNNEDINLKCKIYDLLAIEITEDVDLPQSVCSVCFNKIVICAEFKEQSQKAQSTLREIFLLNNQVKVELSVIEQQIDEDDHFDRNNDESSDENAKSDCDEIKDDIKPVKNEIEYAESNNDRCRSEESVGDDIRKKRWNREVWKNYTWRCNDCEEDIKSSKHFRQHCAEVHHKLPVYVCSICSKTYQHKQFGAFYKHIYKHFNEFQYRCDICGKLSYRPDIHDQHVRTHSATVADTKHICAQCGKIFKTAQYLRRHSILHLPKENRTLFTCETCNKTFQTISALKYHNAIHTGTRVLIYCEQCGKSFTTKSNLALHIKTQHSEERPYHCEQCPKRFKSIPNLHTHLKVHLGLKKHKCNVCGKLFATKPSLKRHSSTHSGVLPFECSFCNKRFRIAQFLKIHVRQHTGERPFSCLQCNHHFANSSNYIKHMKSRHGVQSVAKDPVNCNAKYLKSITSDSAT